MHARRIVVMMLLAGFPVLADTAAVIPFWGDTHPSNLDWIGESISETVREGIGSRGVLTIDRNAVQEAFTRLGLRTRTPLAQASVMKIGEELDAEQVVFGTYAFTPDASAGAGTHGSLRISGRILDLKRLRLGPEFVESGSLEDLATLEAHLAWRALVLLAPKLAPPESEFRSVKVAVRLDAQENYVRGLLARDPEQREKLFLQAARLDARFAHPCYQLGQIHYQRKEYRQAAEWLLKIGPEDLHFREATFLLGLALFQSGDYPGAQKAFQTVAAEVPLSEVFNDLGAAESRRNAPQALDDFKKALDGDPNDADYHFNLGYALWKKGDFAPAADHFRASLAHNPEDQMATLLLGRCLKKDGLHQTQGRGESADARLVGLERLKTNYEERAYWQLKSMLDQKTP